MAFRFSSFSAAFARGVSLRRSFLPVAIGVAFFGGLLVAQGCTLAVTANNTQAEAEPDVSPEPEEDAGRVIYDAGNELDAGKPASNDGGLDAGVGFVDAGFVLERCADAPCFPGVACVDNDEGITCDACPEGLIGDGRICVQGTETPAEVYANTCASCHGANGEGGSAASLNGSYVRAVLFGQVAAMPPGTTGPDCGGPSPCTGGMVDYILNAFATEVPGDDEGGQNNTTGFAGAVLLTPAQTLRKAALLFARRYPTTLELDGVDESNIRGRIRALMIDEGFRRFLLDGANDLLLTERFVDGATTARALSIFATTFDEYHYFQANVPLNLRLQTAENDLAASGYSAESYVRYNRVVRETNRAFSEEPLRLIAHVVENERPYTEILSARYVMMNPFSNDFFQGQINFSDEDDPEEWREGGIFGYQLQSTYPPDGLSDTVIEQTSYGQLPTSGVLTSPAFLTRYPSTDTNKHRARARAVYQLFLGIDIEGLIERSQDDASAVSNPQTPNTSCRGCHELMDPVAGAYQNWGHRATFLNNASPDYINGGSFRHTLPASYVYTDDGGYDLYEFGDRWYRIDEAIDILPGYHDGLNFVPMPTEGGLPYKDIDRTTGFDDGVQWLAAQIAQDPRFATGTTKFWAKAVYGIYPSRPSLAVNDELNRLATEFWTHKNLKDLLVEMAMSPLFRMVQVDPAEHDQGIEHLSLVGNGRVSTPEFFARKFEALTGDNWDEGFLSEYFFFFGGIDSDGIVERPEAMNTVVAAAYERMAQSKSCDVVQTEFGKLPSARVLFSTVEMTDVPGFSVVTDDLLKDTLVRLHFRLLGEELGADAPEIETTFALFQEVYDLQLVVPPGNEACDEVNPVAQAWMSVILYLMGDPAFLFE